MLSDKEDRLYRYNLHTCRIDRSTPLLKFAQKGITFLPDGKICIADDNGRLLIYPAGRIPLRQ